MDHLFVRHEPALLVLNVTYKENFFPQISLLPFSLSCFFYHSAQCLLQSTKMYLWKRALSGNQDQASNLLKLPRKAQKRQNPGLQPSPSLTHSRWSANPQISRCQHRLPHPPTWSNFPPSTIAASTCHPHPQMTINSSITLIHSHSSNNNNRPTTSIYHAATRNTSCAPSEEVYLPLPPDSKVFFSSC